MSLLEKLMPLIPEDKQPDVKALIDGEIQTVAKETETAVRKEISKTYGINVFEKDVDKAFSNDRFVKKEVVAEKEQTINTLNEQLQTVQSELDNYKTNAELTRSEEHTSELQS